MVDLSIIHLREMGESCGVDEGNFRSNQGVRGDGVSEEIGVKATVSGDVKESVCNGEWNVILPNTKSINGLKWVSQLYPSTAAQLESNGVT